MRPARVIGAAVLLACLATAARPEQAAAAIPASARQLIVVSGGDTLRLYARAGAHARWRAAGGPWPAETGWGGLSAHRHEGDGTTPIGTFAIGPTVYGVEPRPAGLHYRYHHLVCGDWWDEDPYSTQYNRFVHVRCGTTPAFAPGSEALWTETVAYTYFAVIEFNVDPIVGGAGAPGSGIFLHSWVGGPTDGCVALEPVQLLEVLRWLRPARHPVIQILP